MKVRQKVQLGIAAVFLAVTIWAAHVAHNTPAAPNSSPGGMGPMAALTLFVCIGFAIAACISEID